MKEVIVVEGKNDLIKLKRLFPNNIIKKTSGLGFSKSFIDELVYYEEKGYKIILLLDPDSAGSSIRRKLKRYLKSPIDIFPKKEDCLKNNTVGVENIKDSKLKELLKDKIDLNNKKCGTLLASDLLELGLTGCDGAKDLRKKVSDYFKIGHTNSKRLLEVLNILGIKKDKLKEVINVST